jgi:hypothetical protein
MLIWAHIAIAMSNRKFSRSVKPLRIQQSQRLLHVDTALQKLELRSIQVELRSA